MLNSFWLFIYVPSVVYSTGFEPASSGFVGNRRATAIALSSSDLTFLFFQSKWTKSILHLTRRKKKGNFAPKLILCKDIEKTRLKIIFPVFSNNYLVITF